jgi:hypothetical protein
MQGNRRTKMREQKQHTEQQAHAGFSGRCFFSVFFFWILDGL